MPKQPVASSIAESEVEVTRTPIRPPPARRLRVYAFDPNASLDLGSVKFSHATISLAWDDMADEETIHPGPVNQYLEVIDVDPSSNQFYEPIDLNAPEVLAQDGLPPSEGDPRFHQQMVFAVVMKTIKLFERALGRKVMWAPTWDEDRGTYVETPRLRVYPHALREANAYYSPTKKALLFGYFNASQRSAGASWIFTCLSHDIIVHETTHAILDGLHPRYSEPSSVDSLAFHEAFADIAALLSHFQLYEAVYDYIGNSGGRLDQSGLLTGLASQFAKGTSGRAALRDYIDKAPDPDLLAKTSEPHERGAILVAAVFDAFLSIYTARTEDLLRLSGTRLGTSQHLHPDLTSRLCQEATKSADHVLRMCIRALDYMPPVDVTFGEFLRAIITADTDLIPDDRMNYRLAFVEAFRRRGIFPEHCLSMSPDNLLWEGAPPGILTEDILDSGLDLLPVYRRSRIFSVSERNRRKVWYWLLQPSFRVVGDLKTGTWRRRQARLNKLLSAARVFFAKAADADTKQEKTESDAKPPKLAAPTRWVEAEDRYASSDAAFSLFLRSIRRDLRHFRLPPDGMEALRRDLDAQRRLIAEKDPSKEGENHLGLWVTFLRHLNTCADVRPDPALESLWEALLGIYFPDPEPSGGAPRPAGTAPPPQSIRRGRHGLSVEVHSVRTTRRAGPDGQDIRQLVIEVTQRRYGHFDEADQTAHDANWSFESKKPTFTFRGGATLIIDLRDGELRYVIRKSIADEARLKRQRTFLQTADTMSFTYDRGGADEPFALLHRH